MKPARIPRASLLAALLIVPLNLNADFVPIPLTPDSYSQDVVVERTAPPPIPRGFYTTASMDNGANNTGNTWYEQGYLAAAPTTGLPTAGSIITSAADPTQQFQFAPSYAAPNALMINATTFRNSTATFTTPVPYTAIAFLTSGGNGGCVFRWTVTYSDGSTETGTQNSPDWFNQTPIAFSSAGRVNAQDYGVNNVNTTNPRLYSRVASLTGTLPVTKVDIEYVSSANNAHSCIMAISGATEIGGPFLPIPFTGYNADIVVEEAAPERASLVNAGVATATMDGGTARTGNTWYEQGYAFNAPATGLPAPGSTLTSAATLPHSYLMAPSYAEPNAAFLNSTLSTATLTPQTPTAVFGLSFLVASSGGGSPVEWIVTHADASTQEGAFTIPDWFNQNPAAFTAAGRVNLDTSVLDAVNSTNPRLYGIDIGLRNTTSPVTRIDFLFGGTTQRAVIFAISGSSEQLAPFFLAQPAAARAFPEQTATFQARVSGTEPFTFQWQRGSGGTFTDIAEGGIFSGTQTDTLTITGVSESDEMDYRLVVNNASGSATSSVVPLTVLSPLPRITAPTDSITGFGGTWPDAEAPARAIDANTSKYLNRGANNGANPFAGPVGFVVTPSQGRTILGAIRFYTANDADGRDPMDYRVEGSDDGGATWSLVSNGPLALPLGRNGANQALNPVTHNLQEVLINNSTPYSSYRVSFNSVRTPSTGLFQIGEVEMLGTVDTSGAPFFSAQPRNAVGQAGGTVTLTATANGNPSPAVQWYRSVNGGDFQPLADGGNISGAQTGTLTISNLSANDAGNYRAVASNQNGTATSATVSVRVLSSLQDITSSLDLLVAVGDESNGLHGGAGNPALIVDDTTSKYINGGSGFSSAAGFPPFGGPAGVVITPAAGATIVRGLRVYTADGNAERDPVSYKLEGSNDDGATYSEIATGPLNPSLNRNVPGQALDPLIHTLEEISFANDSSYTSYRLTFLDVRNPNTANSVQVAEIELLGTVGVSGPRLEIQYSAGTITITWPGNGTLEYVSDLNQAGNPANWTQVGNSGNYSEAVPAGAAIRIFRVRQP